MGINPTGTVSVDLPLDDLPISVRLNGEYEMSENEMAPKELTVDIDAGSVGPVDVSGVLTIGDPLGARELTGEATLAHEYGTVTFDSTEAMPKEVTIRALSKAGVEVRPSWNPRIGAPEGLSFDIDARLQADSDRAVIYATAAAPGKDRRLDFISGSLMESGHHAFARRRREGHEVRVRQDGPAERRLGQGDAPGQDADARGGGGCRRWPSCAEVTVDLNGPARPRRA